MKKKNNLPLYLFKLNLYFLYRICNLYNKKLKGLIDQASVKSGHIRVRSVISAFCLERQKSFVGHIVNPDFEHQFSYVFNVIICLHAIITISTKTHENIQLIMEKKRQW